MTVPEHSKRILVIGEVCREAEIPALTRDGPGRLVSRGEVETGAGGDGLSAAVALACFGHEALLCSVIGTDPDGKTVSRQISGIDVPGRGKFDPRFVRQDAASGTPMRIILPKTEKYPPETVLVRPDGYEITPEVVGDAFMCYPEVTVLMNGVSQEGYGIISEKTQKRSSALFVADCTDAQSLRALGKCDVLSLPEERVTAITGIALSDQSGCLRAVARLSELIKSDYVVLRLPERGFFVSDSSFYSFIPAYDIPPADARANDALFTAMFVHSYIESEGDLRSSCEYGAAAVAAYVTSGSGMLPNDAGIRKFAQQNGIKL